jgi:hypothetical protein
VNDTDTADNCIDRVKEDAWWVAKEDKENGNVRTGKDVAATIDLGQMYRIAGIEGPYDDPAEHYGHMSQAVLDAFDLMVETLYVEWINAYDGDDGE